MLNTQSIDTTRQAVDADTLLKMAGRFWFLVAIAGQWVFLGYILSFYGGHAIQGSIASWSEHPNLRHGYIAGDWLGNLMFGGHVLMAAIISFGGSLQLIPAIRARALRFHLWNGRLFVMSAIAISLVGLYLVWLRDGTPNLAGALSISLNAVLVLLFAALAWSAARQRNVAAHRRWALRLFMVANGVWFFRVGLMAWIAANGGPVGIGEHFDGPAVLFWNLGCYLLPLAVLELYLQTQDGTSRAARLLTAAGIGVLTIAMGFGIMVASKVLWLPLI